MLPLFVSLSFAHDLTSSAIPEHNILIGYQHRSLVPTENYQSSHCSILQYGVAFPLNRQKTIGSFVEPSLAIVGLNQSIARPIVSMTVGFQFGQYVRFGTGPIVALRPAIDPPFFPQLLIESTFLVSIDGVDLPIKLSYVPRSQGLEQYQILVGYTFVFRQHESSEM